ncbi:MAG: hypothetical protein JXA54_00020 [Candidatus Heimdallarchaeota archaeon]|nr:hypothetical protein [Candidatus Heimdallarchaeota archaeon]
MTAQMADMFNYNKEKFEIIGVDGKKLFEPKDYSLNPHFTCTACWRGYLLTYTLNNNQLVLDDVLINLKEKKKINGVKPKDAERPFLFQYKKVNLKIDFTGTILAAKDFIPEMYVHMGFQRAIGYKKIIEFKFTNGNLDSITDLSKQMEERRKEDPDKGAKPKSPYDEDVKSWIEDTFSLDYKTKEKK